MSRHRKGLRSKRKAKAWLRHMGYHVADIENNSKYGTTDAFGIADLLALHDGEPLLVQVKTNQPETQAVMQRVADCLIVCTMCATWYDREGLRLQHYVPGYEGEGPEMDEMIPSRDVTHIL
jgi:hypothetical protein